MVPGISIPILNNKNYVLRTDKKNKKTAAIMAFLKISVNQVSNVFLIHLLCILLTIALPLQSAGTIVVNEIFPRASAVCPEWIELYNTSLSPANLKGWFWGHADDSTVVATIDLIIAPTGFLILAKDSTSFRFRYPAVRAVFQPPHWHALDNYHDSLILWNASGAVSDSFGWDSRWFTNWTDQSLARISQTMNGQNSNSWVVADNASPGQPNPEVLWHNAPAPVLHICPIPFTPNHDNKDDLLMIQLTLPAGATASLTVYGFDGRKIYEINNISSAETTWDGNMTSGKAAPCGPFFVVAEVNCNGSKQVLRQKGILWR
jgi:hypothetical protein